MADPRRVPLLNINGVPSGDQDSMSVAAFVAANAAGTLDPLASVPLLAVTGLPTGDPNSISIDELIALAGVGTSTDQRRIPLRRSAAISSTDTNSSPLLTLLTGGGLDVDAAAYIARMTIPPTATRQSSINGVFVAGKRDGWLQKLDALFLFAAHSSQAARLNLIADQYNLTPVAAPTFATDRGYTGDGSSSYLNSSFVPSTAGGKLTLNSASLAVWSLTNIRKDGGAMIGSDAQTNCLYYNPWNSSINSASHGANDASENSISPGTVVGLNVLSRTALNIKTLYKNGAAIGTSSTTSGSVPTLPMRALGGIPYNGGTNWSTNGCAVALWGAGLTGSDVASVYSTLLKYLQDLGATP